MLALITTGWREEWVVEESEVTYPCDIAGNPLDLASEYEVFEPPEDWQPSEPEAVSQDEPSDPLLRRPLTSLSELRIDGLSVLKVATDILSVIIPGCTDPDAHYNEPRSRYNSLLGTGLTANSPLPSDLLETVGEGSYRRFDLIDAFQVDETRIIVIWLPNRPERGVGIGILTVAELIRATRPGNQEPAWRFADYVEVYGCYDGAVRDEEIWFSGRADLAQSGLRLGKGSQRE